MMHPRLSVNSMCSFRWPFERDLALWRDLGVQKAGVMFQKISDNPEVYLQQLTDAGIHCATLITEAFNLSDRSSWETTRAAQFRAIDLVAAHKGRSIYFTPGRSTTARWSEDMETLAEALGPTVAHGREKGVLAAIEPSLRCSASFVNTLRDAIDVAERSGIGIVADFGNMWMERDFRETLAKAMPHIALMQFGDIVIGGPHAAPSGMRVHVGQGEMPLRRMMQDVLDAGYDGPFDLEVVPPDFSAETDEGELRRGIQAASKLLEDMGI